MSNNQTPTNPNLNTNTENSYGSVPVYVIGNYGIAPWGSASKFPDKTAQWIWYTSMANAHAPANTQPVKIQYTYNNTLNSSIGGTLYIMIDNKCDVYLNNKKIASSISGGWTSKPQKVSFIAQPGENLFEFACTNSTGPAGLIVSAMTSVNNQNNILFHSDSSWKFLSILPKPIQTCKLSRPNLITNTDKYFPFGCLNLSGNDYVSVEKIITGMEGLSFGMWFRSDSNKEGACLFDFGSSSNNRVDDIAIYIYKDNKISFGNWVESISSIDYETIPLSNSNKWNHIVWTMSKPQYSVNTNTQVNQYISTWKIYLNGKIVNSVSGTYPNNGAMNYCWIGKSNVLNSEQFKGAIANFVMYQKVLSSDEVNALYNGLINSFDPTLYLYLPFAMNTFLDTTIGNYAGKSFNLPTTQSNVKSENWNCMPNDNGKWIGVKMNSGKPVCMSVDGKTCVEGTSSECKAILSNSQNTITNPVVCIEPIESTSNPSWCVNAKKILSSTHSSNKEYTEAENLPNVPNSIPATEAKPGIKALSALDVSTEAESVGLKQLLGGGKVLGITNSNDVSSLMIGGVFKLRVNLPMMPPYIKGKSFDTKVGSGSEPNYFYLSVEKLDNNCSIKASNGSCINVFADDKKCSSKALTSWNLNNSYRLVLISSQYVLDPSVPIGKNSDFTLVQVGGQTYLKNVQTGYLPSLYSNDSNILVYGDMLVNSNTNVNKVEELITNITCGQETKPVQTSGTKNIRCNIEQNPGTYLMTSNNIGSSSPVRININNDKTISLNLLVFNKYGYPTENYALTSCNFNVQTYSYIEKITNTLGTFLVNMICISNTQNSSSKSNDSTGSTNSQLKFVVELISFPSNFVKNNSVFTIG